MLTAGESTAVTIDLYNPHGSAATGELVRGLLHAPAFAALDAGSKDELQAAVAKVADFLQAPAEETLESPFAGALRGPPNLRQQMAAAGGGQAPSGPAGQPGQPAAPGTGIAPAQGGAPAGGGSATGRVAEVTRATLNAIDFPQFVASLIQGTFKAIVDASIQQMTAYAELLKSVAQTVDRFMDDHITEGMAKDHLADEYGYLFKRDTSKGRPELVVDRTANREVPSFLKDLGFDTPHDLNKQSLHERIIPATRRSLAEQRQQTLATMVLMGINRVVVDDGEILAKLQFHIDASEETSIKFDQQKATTGNMAGEAGTGMFNAQALMVNTASVNAQSDINVRADLTGQVRVKFKSETFPLERFADSAAIQLINVNAKVPEPRVPAGPGPAPAAGGGAAPGAAPAPGAPPAAGPGAAPAVGGAPAGAGAPTGAGPLPAAPGPPLSPVPPQAAAPAPAPGRAPDGAVAP
jgi:hypothetical protein